ncbi:MAG: hypothetical protein HY235_23820 [Acidobacteria bacterium]|nr:hypothetical protein [Acidobacteriota bacterium]
MKNFLKITAAVVIVFSVALTLVRAQSAKKAAGKGPGILQTEWGKVDTGSYQKPSGRLGTKPDAPWTATTMGAAIDGKPNAARIMTVTGEILDFSCYLQVGKHGEKHRSCGQKCFTAGQPIGLLAEDGVMYLLMEEEHDPRRDGLTDFRKAAIEHTAHIMEVTGTFSEHGGYKALYVHGYLKK